MLNAVFERYDIFLFIMVRMLGFVIFNPVFGRRNIPAMTRGAIAFVLAVAALFAITSDAQLAKLQETGIDNLIVFVVLLIKEFVFGYLIGLTVNLFLSIISVSGEIIDIQMGLGMSKVYDPASNVQMPLMGNFYNIVLMLLFFLTNSHITLIKIVIDSFYISPVGVINFNADIGIYLMKIFSNIFVLSLKLAFPVMAAELITETGLGIVMRAVPQINIFVVGVQIKIIVGVAVMIICAPVAVWFFDGMLAQMHESAFEALKVIAG